MTDTASLFRDHLKTRVARAGAILAETGFDAVVLGAGTPILYYADDMEPPFRSNPHFAHWCPLGGPHHAVVVRTGTKPKLVRWAPHDYWYERVPLGAAFWSGEFDVSEEAEAEGVMKAAAAAAGSRAAFVGEDAALASSCGLQANPAALVNRLDWDRAYKTAYEVDCIAQATASSAVGHEAARAAFRAGASELEIHHAYVKGAGCTDDVLPYPTIVCLDEKAATLHYHVKRASGSGKNLLVDAGVSVRGYGCDITRTTPKADADSRFLSLARGVDALQKDLCAMVKPGASYVDIHFAAHRAIGALLVEHGVLKCSKDEAFSEGYTTPFFPHGVGHHLGIQVHDIGGRQKSKDGGTVPPPEGHPYLRNTRPIEEGHLFTIEPGVYFIDMLLEPFRADAAKSRAFDWKQIDELKKLGGIRVEDNVVVTASGHRNITREKLPN